MKRGIPPTITALARWESYRLERGDLDPRPTSLAHLTESFNVTPAKRLQEMQTEPSQAWALHELPNERWLPSRDWLLMDVGRPIFGCRGNAMAKDFSIEGMLRALERRDLEGFLSYLADDVEMYSEDEERPLEGKETLRRIAQTMLPALESMTVKPRTLVQDDRHVAVLADTSARYARDIPLPDGGSLQVRGKSVTGRVALFLDINESGQVTRIHRMRNMLTAMSRLGLTVSDIERLKAGFEPMLHPH